LAPSYRPGLPKPRWKRIDGEDDPSPPPTGLGRGFGAPKPSRKQANGDFRGGIKLRNKT